MVETASLFSQLLQQLSRPQFAQLVKKHQAERTPKGFKCWTQLVAMLFCHMAKADTLRKICNGLSCCLGRLTHLGLDEAPNRSTLAYANRNRPANLFEDLFYETLTSFRDRGLLGHDGKPFRFKNKLLSRDSTTISAIKKKRWKIEIFFKALKQNLKIRTFVGTSENALRIQSWTALIALLVLKWLHDLSRAGWSFSNLASMLRLNLFTYRDLDEWLHNPLGRPPTVPQPEQLQFQIQGFG